MGSVGQPLNAGRRRGRRLARKGTFVFPFVRNPIRIQQQLSVVYFKLGLSSSKVSWAFQCTGRPPLAS